MINDNGRKNTREAPPHEELLNAYYGAALRLVPLKPSLKKPQGNEWQRRPITREEVEDNLKRGGGVGIQAGERSGWVSAADLDHPIARRLASYYLPETLTSGKAGELPSHHVYISEGLGFRPIMDIDGKHIIDIVASNDGAGHQFVVEPSVHEVKGPYKWTGGFNPSKIHRISSEDLDRRIGLLGAATLLAMYYPERGKGRHTFGLCVAGYLLRNGESEEDVRRLMTHARLMQPEEPTKESREGVYYAVESTARKLERDEKVTGGWTLEGMVSGLPHRLARALGWERANTGEGRKSYMRTDDGNTLRFIDRHGELLRYCPPWKCWLVWDGQRWLKGAEGAVMRLARATARSIFAEASDADDEETQKAIAKWAVMSQNANRIQAMISLARSDERVEVAPDAFDADPWLLNVENGTLDLLAGELRRHDPQDHITKLAPVPYEPAAAAPTWDAFVERVLPAEEVRTFVRRAAGYSATGDISEQCLFIHYGFGANGKSTFQEAVTAALGDYALKTPTETLLVKRSGGIPNDVARLKGARYVTASETEDGRRLSESLVKELTGGDTISARFLHAEFFDFPPTHTLHLSTNHKPEIRGTDLAIWRRIRLVPWTVTIPPWDQDRELPKKLRGELPGILAWIVRGCAEWQSSGLDAPEEVRKATEAYRTEMDTLAAFIEDRCVVREGLVAPATRLYKRYQMWCDDAGEKPHTQRTFGVKLGERGFESTKITRGPYKDLKGWVGIGLRTNETDPDDPDPDPEDPDDPDGPSSSRAGEQSRASGNDDLRDVHNAPSNEREGPLSGRTADDRPLPKNAGFAGDSSEVGGERGRSGHKTGFSPLHSLV